MSVPMSGRRVSEAIDWRVDSIARPDPQYRVVDPMPVSHKNSDSRLAGVDKFALLLLDGFASMALSSAIEVLELTNRLNKAALYSWSLITASGESAVSSTGLVHQQVVGGGERGAPELVFVCGGADPVDHIDQSVPVLLRQLARNGVVIGGLSGGTNALLRAGLLDGYKCTAHWENLASLREAHRNTEFVEELFVVDRDRITCAGGTAAIDMMLALVGARFGKALVSEISDKLILDRVRDRRDRQRVPLAARRGFHHPVLAKVGALMEANLEEPLSASAIAAAVDISVRQLQRLFQASVEVTLMEYYRNIRLRRGRQLLLQSHMSVTEIAASCGFRSTGRFSKEYRSLFGRSPRSERREAAMPISPLPISES